MSPNSSSVMKMVGRLVNDVLHWSNHALSPLHRVIKRSQWHQPNTQQWDLLDMHLLSQCTMSLGRSLFQTMLYSCNLLFEWQISKYSWNWLPGVMLHLYTDDGRMANIQIAILCIMPLQVLLVNLDTNNNKCRPSQRIRHNQRKLNRRVLWDLLLPQSVTLFTTKCSLYSTVVRKNKWQMIKCEIIQWCWA